MAGASDSDDSSDIFWPGYVDAISNLAINLLFVIAVMAIVVISATLQISELLKRKDRAQADDISFSVMETKDSQKGSGKSDPQSMTNAESQALKTFAAGTTDKRSEAPNSAAGELRSSAGDAQQRVTAVDPKSGTPSTSTSRDNAKAQSSAAAQAQAQAQSQSQAQAQQQEKQQQSKAQSQAQSQAQAQQQEKQQSKAQSQSQSQSQAQQQEKQQSKSTTAAAQAQTPQEKIQQQEQIIKQQAEQIKQLQSQLEVTLNKLEKSRAALEKAQAASGKAEKQQDGPVGDEQRLGRVETVNATKPTSAPQGKNAPLVVDNGVIVNFAPDVMQLTEAEAKEVIQKMKSFGPVDGSSRWRIMIVVPKGFSEASRLGFYRANAVRNILLQQGVPASAIDVRLLESQRENADASRVIVKPWQ